MTDTLEKLETVLSERKQNPTSNSYTTQLLIKGQDAILKKIGEESTELVMASKDQDSNKIIMESADLMYHMLVLLAHHNLSVSEVMAELERRSGTSGLDEKASRTSKT